MDKSFLVYEKEYVLGVCTFYSDQWTKKRFVLPSEFFGDGKNAIVRHYVSKHLKSFLEEYTNASFMVQYSYDGKNIVLTGGLESMKEVTLLFPYGKYDEYISIVKEINDLVSSDGMVELFVNNNPYSFQSGVCIFTNTNYEQIIQLAKDRKLSIDYSLGHHEVIEGAVKRQYTFATLMPDASLELIGVYMDSMFAEYPKSYYEKAGYRFDTPRKKKLFVSYCHKNKQQVHKIIDDLRSYGLDFWLDEEQIDEGDHLLDRIDAGMREADIPIIFLSQATKESLFAQQELKTFFLQIINQASTKKKWFIVKLDSINPDDILMGLGGFKYFDIENHSVEDLANRLKVKFEHLE